MHSIRTKILVIVLVFVALICAAFILYSVRTTVNYKRLRLEGIEKTVEFETEKVNKIIAEIERGAVFYALGGMLCYEAQSEELGEKLAVEYVSSFPVSIGGGFWFEPYAFKKDRLRVGFYAFYDKAAGKVRLDDTFFIDEYDYHNMIWYREIVDNVKRPYQVVWTRPYVDDTGSFSLMTTAGAGIFEDGRLIAMSTADWEIEEVVKELTAIYPTKNSFVLLCVPEKDYIISSTNHKSIPGESIGIFPCNSNADTFLFDGVNYMRFGRYMDNGWLLSIYIPEKEIFAEVESQNNRFLVLVALSSTVMLFLAFLLISGFINAPIKQLTSGVSRLALGNLDTQIKISSNDELGQLAQVFNKMTSDLKKSIEENVRERAEKERIGAELNVAKEIQASMLPCIFPPFPDRTEFDIFASMLPAKEVGGDFYDFFFIDRDNLAVVIADVSGKGVPAALFMVITKTLIKNCSFCKSPKAVFDSVNKKLCENNETGMFVTSFAGIYNIPTGRFAYVNAGHNPPLVKKHGKGYEFLKSEPCLVLAFLKDAKYREDEIFLEPGDTIYLYTDGVTEAMNHDKDMFGETRLLASLNQYKDSPPHDLLYAVKREVDKFTDGAEQADDITMLAINIIDAAANSREVLDDSFEHLKIEAKVENLDKVIAFVNTELEKNKCLPDLKSEIDIAVEEIFINIVNYAYKPGSGDAAISISTRNKTIIRFEDSGKPYNPLEQPSPDLDKPLAERKIGGLGIFLVKKIMDNIKYSRTENKNILIMTKEHLIP